MWVLTRFVHRIALPSEIKYDFYLLREPESKRDEKLDLHETLNNPKKMKEVIREVARESTEDQKTFMETPKNENRELDELVRDFSQFRPRPKSEIRSRLRQLLKSERQKLLQALAHARDLDKEMDKLGDDRHDRKWSPIYTKWQHLYSILQDTTQAIQKDEETRSKL